MNNYNKIGYSVSEVAQIFGCTPVTIRRYIYDGHLKADVSKNNKQNTIRIRREHLVEYMTEHPGRFDSELLKRFGIGTDDGKPETKIEKKAKKKQTSPREPIPLQMCLNWKAHGVSRTRKEVNPKSPNRNALHMIS